MLKIYDEFLEDDVITALSDRGYRLHVSALVYCARNLTDGEVTTRAVKVLQVILGYQLRRYVDELVTAGLWVTGDDGYRVRNYLEFNPPAEVVKAEKSKGRERMRKLREKRAKTSGDAERSPARDGERSPERDGASRDGAAPYRSLPLEVQELSTQSPTSNEGTETHDLNTLEPAIRKLAFAVNARTKADTDKLVRTIRAHRSSEADIQAAIDAATGPGVQSRLGVALATLTKRSRRAVA